MENKTVKQFAAEYSKSANESCKIAILQKAGIKHYLSISEKRDLIERTLNFDLMEFKDSLITYNSIDKVALFMCSVIAGYTEFIREDVYTDFDALMESGLMGGILTEIGSDADVYRDLFEMRLNDYIRERNSIEAVTMNKINDAMIPVTKFLETVGDFISGFTTEDIIKILKEIKFK